ncbi:MAG TPA: hypothetical protein VJB90_03920 [Candidatus Nanoarchaeia archaeon]|nr:hypothetical protein [Candidatus Nanoarchaeia archaeon]
MITIAGLREIMAQLGERRHCITPNNTLSPYINPPHNNFAPGRLEDIAYGYHNEYPEVFPKPTGFMGSPHSSVRIGTSFWESEFELVYLSEGHFDDEGVFHAPIAAYRKANETSPRYILFQQGNYQIVRRSIVDHLEDGRITLYRGIGNSEYIPPVLDENRRNWYLNFLAGSFVSPLVALAYNNVARHESDHVRVNYEHPVIRQFYCPGVYFCDLEQPFSIFKVYKFGPNFVSVETSLDNIRICTAWTGEGEIKLLDPTRAQRLE